jgi:pimeloyl-ACP methyl ester carboxylesterase
MSAIVAAGDEFLAARRVIQRQPMPTVDLPAGPIEYTDSGGDGPVLVLLHGLVMDGTVFDEVVRDLREDHRCIVPTMPLGSHRKPMRPDADLSLRGFGTIVADFLEALDLEDVTLVQNDHAAALVAAGDRPERIGRLVLSSCEAFENYPPGLPGKNAGMLARVPGAIYPAMQLMRVRALRRLPIVLGWMAKKPIPGEVTDAWFRPIQANAEIRRDFKKYAGKARKRDMLEVMERLRSFRTPALVIWASEDRVMPRDHGRRLAELLPDARLVEIADSYTLIPHDQPAEFARAVREFVAESRQTGKPREVSPPATP